jgi:hypothetical protein
MKTLKIFFAFALAAMTFVSCEEDGVQAVLKKNVAPNQLEAPADGSYVLTKDLKDNVMETFKWTPTDYGFNASVNYTLQAALEGDDFENAVEVGATYSKSINVNVGAFNDIALGLGLTPEQTGSIELRVVSTIGNPAAPTVISNVETIEVTPYATSFPPIWGMGAALKGWGPWPGNAVEWQSSEYKKYSTITYFTNGATFRWFNQLDWGPLSFNYPYFTSVDTEFENANDGDSNFRVTAASGWYRVDVDLVAKTVVAESVSEPVLYMMGGALNGWGPWPGAAVKMTYLKPGVFEAEANFKNDIFRFFTQADWGAGYNFEYFTTMDPNFVLSTPDNDKNLKYIGTPGVQKITVDLNTKTLTLGTPPDPVLFITGDDFGWGWGAGQYVEMTYKGGNVFETTHTLTNDKLFRFFPQKDWSPSYNFSYFTTVDNELVNQGVGGDENFRYTGTTGSRKITVNMTTKTVTID